MNKTFKLFLVYFLFVYFTIVEAFSSGRTGVSTIVNDIEWQQAYYKDRCRLTAFFPGIPVCGLDQDWVFIRSSYQEATYLFRVEHNVSVEDLPETADEFIQDYCQGIAMSEITPVSVNQPHVRYAIEFKSKYPSSTESSIWRLYVATHQFYYFFVMGKDLSLAPTFFDSIQFQ